MGWLTSPHQTFRAELGSRTMNLSSGERPVCFPVRTTSGPLAASCPSPSRIAASYSSAVERFARTARPSTLVRWLDLVAGTGRVDWVVIFSDSWRGDQFDRPA